MQPYIYTEARRTYDTGVAFVHPLYYDWPQAAESYDTKGEYMFGDSMLVAPVTLPSAKDSELVKQTVWLPEGDWIERDTGSHLKGPISTDRTFSISQIPVYVKVGSIIPMQPEMSYTAEKPVDPLILAVFPPPDGQSSAYRFYQDAGNTSAYRRGEEAWTNIHANSSADGTTTTVKIAAIEGHYLGMKASRAYEIRLRGVWPPDSVTLNGESLSHKESTQGWSYDAGTLTTIIRTRSVSTAQAVTIVAKIKPSLARHRELLGGFAGKMTRLRETYDILNASWPEGWTPDALIDAMQTADRIGYHPETAMDELSALPAKLAALPGKVQDMHKVEESPDFRSAAEADALGQSKIPTSDVIARYHKLVDLGAAHLTDILPQSK
jgi:hypothetical protein